MPMLSRNALRILVVAIATAALPRPASADPVRITGGSVDTQLLQSLARVFFEGDGFRLRVGVEGFVGSLALSCTPCTPGTTLDLGGRFDLPRASGEALVNGVTYPTIFVDGMTGTFTTPSFVIDGTGDVRVSLPFSYSGTVTGYILDPFVHGLTEPAFTVDLAGSGTASATLFYTDTDGQRLFSANALRYDFEDTAAVPEPATLMLCGLGTALMALRRKRAL